MILVIVMLAFAVFSWGVRYKLSLYNPAAHVSAAKLLSQRERPATVEAAKLAADPLPELAPIALFASLLNAVLIGLLALQPALLLRDMWQQARISRKPSQNFFFFRPPPAAFASR